MVLQRMTKLQNGAVTLSKIQVMIKNDQVTFGKKTRHSLTVLQRMTCKQHMMALKGQVAKWCRDPGQNSSNNKE